MAVKFEWNEIYELGRNLDLRTFDDVKALIEKFNDITGNIGEIATDANVTSIVNVLVHISNLDTSRVEKVEDIVREGDEIVVKVIGFDDKGKVMLSRKDAIAAPKKDEN